MKVAVVGNGVIGLSVACRLSGSCREVTIISGQPPGQTTSAVAAAYWGPYFVGAYDRAWALDTWRELYRLASDPELSRASGTSLVDFQEWLTEAERVEVESQLFSPSKPSVQASIQGAEPYWWRELPGVDFRLESLIPSQRISLPDLGTLEFAAQLQFRSVVARMPDYLQFLQAKVEARGNVTFISQWVDHFDELLERFDIVVNCTGWGAKRLVANDPATARMKLLAGLVVRVEAPEQRSAFSLGHGLFAQEPLYIIPRHGSRTDSICGGTAIEIQGETDPRLPFPFAVNSQCDRIYARCAAASSAIGTGKRCENLAGIRPMRESVRIERDQRQDRLIHCYGHGGSGLTLSWGSAGRVVELVEELTNAETNSFAN